MKLVTVDAVLGDGRCAAAVEREAEDNEKETGVLRAPSVPNAPKQLARIRTRKLALVIGNPTGPGDVVTAVCRDDATQVGKHLSTLGFEVTLKIDADRLEMVCLPCLRDSSLHNSTLGARLAPVTSVRESRS